jgi:hypothetical protein
MTSKQEGPDREIESLQSLLWERARRESERLTAAEADQALLEETGPARPQLAPLFEPDQPDPSPAGLSPAAAARPATAAPRRRPPAGLLVVAALALAVGLAVGFALGSARVDGEPTSAPATHPPGSGPPTSVVVQPAATPACLETARRGDQLIELFVANRRDRIPDLLVAYSVASRQCRREASP